MLLSNLVLLLSGLISSGALLSADASTPLILGWSDFSGANIIRTIAPQEQTEACAKKCTYSEDKNDAERASAIVFHRAASASGPSHSRRPEQLYMLFELESPAHTNAEYFLHDFYNLTMTYRANDAHNLMAPYGYVHRVDRSNPEDLQDMWSEREVLEKISGKLHLVLQVVSNCGAQSGREALARELARHLNITSYGNCFGRRCDNECYWRELEAHFFYLALENSVCRHYVTEKFWRAFRRLTVPIVASRAVLEGLDDIPRDAFVAADDFGSAQEMASFLAETSADPQRYLSFFNWTRFLRRTSDIEPRQRAICRLCEMAHRRWRPGELVLHRERELGRAERECKTLHGQALVHWWREHGKVPSGPKVAPPPAEWEEPQMDLMDRLALFGLLAGLFGCALFGALTCLQQRCPTSGGGNWRLRRRPPKAARE